MYIVSISTAEVQVLEYFQVCTCTTTCILEYVVLCTHIFCVNLIVLVVVLIKSTYTFLSKVFVLMIIKYILKYSYPALHKLETILNIYMYVQYVYNMYNAFPFYTLVVNQVEVYLN